MKTIEIKIPELGNAAGTLNWVADKLLEIQKSLKIGKTKNGLPCLTYQHPFDKKNDEYKRYIFCKPYIESDDDGCYKRINNISIVYELDDDSRYKFGIFKYLTPSAKIKVNEFITSIAENFEDSLLKL